MCGRAAARLWQCQIHSIPTCPRASPGSPATTATPRSSGSSGPCAVIATLAPPRPLGPLWLTVPAVKALRSRGSLIHGQDAGVATELMALLPLLLLHCLDAWSAHQ